VVTPLILQKEGDDMKKNSQEWLDWCELHDYVKKEILQYDDNIKLPKYMILRLQGLKDGKFIANKKIQPNASYEYKTILYTFKICKPKILQYLTANKTKFKDEKHKFNSIMIFIENEINDVVLRIKNKQQSESKIENMTLDNHYNQGAEYRKQKGKNNKNLEYLW
jgi:hypothetical protein